MKIIKRGIFKGRKFELGKITHSEKDILNKERSFNRALATLYIIRKERERLFKEKSMPFLEKAIYGKRKAG
ncbi:MAG: hypothetical protein ABII74_09185 [Elusimicrobiota bacterium]